MPACGIHNGTATRPCDTSFSWYEMIVMSQAYHPK